MDGKLRIKVGDVAALASLNDSRTARAIWQALPVEARANTWSFEIYFSIPVDQPEDAAVDAVDLPSPCLTAWSPRGA